MRGARVAGTRAQSGGKWLTIVFCPHYCPIGTARQEVPWGTLDRLAEIGEWLVRCDTGEEFLDRAGTLAADLRDRNDG